VPAKRASTRSDLHPAVRLFRSANPRGRDQATNSIDDGKLADYIGKTTFQTVAGDIKFGARGEWAEPRVLYVQYRGIVGNDVDQFKQAGKQVILYPPRFKSGEVQGPFQPIVR